MSIGPSNDYLVKMASAGGPRAYEKQQRREANAGAKSIITGGVIGGIIGGPAGAVVGAMAGKAKHDAKRKY